MKGLRKIIDMTKMKESMEALMEFLPKDPIFICVGTDRVGFDSFGPVVGSTLKRAGFKVYGTITDPMDAKTIPEKLINVMIEEGIKDLENDDRIVAIDACVVSEPEYLYKVILRDIGIKPGSGLGKDLPKIGCRSIVFPTVLEGEDIREKIINEGEDKGISVSAAKMLGILIDGLTVMA